jgi:hypothetical protein
VPDLLPFDPKNVISVNVMQIVDEGILEGSKIIRLSFHKFECKGILCVQNSDEIDAFKILIPCRW